MIKRYSKSDKVLYIQDDAGEIRKLEFETQIFDCLLYDNSLIVYVGNNSTYLGRNIFRISEDGRIVWQVEEPQPYLGTGAGRSVAFSHLGLNQEGRIIGYSLNCFTYEIYFETGKLSNPVFTK